MLLVTVIVRVTALPASPAAAVYVGVKVVAPAVIEPAPFSVHAIVPFEALASPPVKVYEPVWQIVALPPAEADGEASTFTV